MTRDIGFMLFQLDFFIFNQSCSYRILFSLPLTNGSIGENEHLFTSHHALGTAYEHMKRRLTEVEQINRSLNRRLKASNPIPVSRYYHHHSSFNLVLSLTNECDQMYLTALKSFLCLSSVWTC